MERSQQQRPIRCPRTLRISYGPTTTPCDVVIIDTSAPHDVTSSRAYAIITDDERDADVCFAVQSAIRRTVWVSQSFPAETRTALWRRLAIAHRMATDLTPREHEIAALLLGGTSNDHIARMLGIAASTVECHVRRVLRKHGSTNGSEFIAAHVAP